MSIQVCILAPPSWQSWDSLVPADLQLQRRRTAASVTPAAVSESRRTRLSLVCMRALARGFLPHSEPAVASCCTGPRISW